MRIHCLWWVADALSATVAAVGARRPEQETEKETAMEAGSEIAFGAKLSIRRVWSGETEPARWDT